MAIVLGCCNRQLDVAGFKDMQFKEVVAKLNERSWVWNALQNFTKDQVGKPYALSGYFVVQPICLCVADTVEVVDPNRCVNDHHW